MGQKTLYLRLTLPPITKIHDMEEVKIVGNGILIQSPANKAMSISDIRRGN